MADEKVGGVYLEIGAEPAKGEPKKTIAEIRRRVAKERPIKLPSALEELRRSSLNAAVRSARDLAKTVKPIELPSEVKAPLRKSLNAARRQAQAAAKSLKPIEFPAELEMPKASQLRRTRSAIQKLASSPSVELPVELEKSRRFTAELASIRRDVENDPAELPIHPDLDRGLFLASMATLTRPRTVPIIPRLDKSAAALVASQLAALSGGRAITDRLRGLADSLLNLDRTVPAIAGVSTAILNLSSLAAAGVSNLLALGGSLSSIAGTALALPGIFMGFGAGLGVMIAALKDAGKVLEDLGPAFSELQDTISDNFWSVAEEPIRNLVQTWLPSLETGLGSIATQLGSFFSSLSGALSSAENVGHLDAILAATAESIDRAAEGVAWFADGIMGLGEVGASYLPQLASWFNRISESFAGWVEQNTANGNLFEWIDAGIVALQDLGGVIWGIGGVFSNLGRAAAAAGGASLGALADGLRNVNAALEGPIWQGALTTFFQGAHDGVAALSPGIAALGDAFLSLSPVLAELMVTAGEIGSVALAAISEAFQNPVFQGGLIDFFRGVQAGVDALAPHIPALAEAFGSVASFAGVLASVLGPVLGAAIEALAPVVTEVMEAFSALAPVLGSWLVTAIQAVAPVIQEVVSAISEWVQQNPQLAATIGIIAGVLGGLIAGAVSLVGALLPVVSSIVGVISAASGMGLTLSGVGSAIAGVLGPVGIVVASIAALAAAFTYAWQTSAPFREAVVGLFAALLAAAQPVIAFFQETVFPVVQQVAAAFMGMVTQIMDALVPLWTVMLEIFTRIIEILTPVISFVLDVFAPIFTHLGTIVSAAFTFIGTVISAAINIITSILQVFLAVIQGDWSGAWQAILNVGVTIWESIKSIIGAAITFVWTIIQSTLSTITGIWNAVWSHIASFVTVIFSRILSGAISFISGVRSVISSGVRAVQSVWNSVWSAISSFVSSIFSLIAGFVSNGISRVRSTVTSGMNAVRSTFFSVLSAVASFVVSVLSRIVSGFSNGLSRVRSTVSSGLNAVLSLFSRILNAVVSVVTNGASRVVSGFRNMMNRAKSVVTGFVSQFRSVGSDIVQGIINGVTGAAGRLTSTMKNLAKGALDAAKGALGINSPSKEFAKIGAWSGEGFVQGIERMARTAQRAAEDLVALPTPSVPAPLPTPAPVAAASSQGAGGGAEDTLRNGGLTHLTVQMTTPESADPTVWASRFVEVLDFNDLLGEIGP